MTPSERQRQQYEHERKYHFLLLEAADVEARRGLYAEAYGILYRDFFNDQSGKTEFGSISCYTEMIRRWGRGRTIVDVGCGLGEATVAFGRFAARVVGLEVDSDVVRRCNERFQGQKLDNCEAVLFDGRMIPLPDASADVVYSNNVFEHLHPDDMLVQTREAFRILRPGGRLVIITPPRETGPHDISKFFLKPGSIAEGLHLREYTLGEVDEILRGIGFRSVTQPWIEPSRLASYGLLALYPFLQRGVGLSLWLEGSPARRSGFLTGHLCLDNIIVCARK